MKQKDEIPTSNFLSIYKPELQKKPTELNELEDFASRVTITEEYNSGPIREYYEYLEEGFDSKTVTTINGFPVEMEVDYPMVLKSQFDELDSVTQDDLEHYLDICRHNNMDVSVRMRRHDNFDDAGELDGYCTELCGVVSIPARESLFYRQGGGKLHLHPAQEVFDTFFPDAY